MSEIYGQIPMTPDSTIKWDIVNWSRLGGFALLSQECPSETVDMLRRVSAVQITDPRTKLGRELGSGSSGTVYGLSQDLAVKVTYFSRPASDHFPELRTMVTLSEGLARIQPNRDSVVDYTAPTHYGAYFPYQHNGAGTCVIAMSRLLGYRKNQLSRAQHRLVPSVVARVATYGAAVQQCGGDPTAYDFDMDPDNELFQILGIHYEPAPSRLRNSKLQVVKLDADKYRPLETLYITDTSLYDEFDVPDGPR